MQLFIFNTYYIPREQNCLFYHTSFIVLNPVPIPTGSKKKIQSINSLCEWKVWETQNNNGIFVVWMWDVPTGPYIWMFGPQLVMPLYNPEEVEPSWRKWLSTVTGIVQSHYVALLPKLSLLPLLGRRKMSQQIRNGFPLPYASSLGPACPNYLLQMSLIPARCGPKHILPPLTVRYLVTVMIKIRNMGYSE